MDLLSALLRGVVGTIRLPADTANLAMTLAKVAWTQAKLPSLQHQNESHPPRRKLVKEGRPEEQCHERGRHKRAARSSAKAGPMPATASTVRNHAEGRHRSSIYRGAGRQAAIHSRREGPGVSWQDARSPRWRSHWVVPSSGVRGIGRYRFSRAFRRCATFRLVSDELKRRYEPRELRRNR